MSWVDDLFGTESNDNNCNSKGNNNNGGNGGNGGDSNNGNNANNFMPSDKDTALDMLIMSKADITSLAKAVTETTNPLLRQMLCTQLNNCINQHFRLSDIAIGKQWYNAFASPQQQIQQSINEGKNLP